jgi:hypothetical protein
MCVSDTLILRLNVYGKLDLSVYRRSHLLQDICTGWWLREKTSRSIAKPVCIKCAPVVYAFTCSALNKGMILNQNKHGSDESNVNSDTAAGNASTNDALVCTTAHIITCNYKHTTVCVYLGDLWKSAMFSAALHHVSLVLYIC